MTVYVRLWNCGVCGGYVYFDDQKGTITCECGIVQVNLPMPPKHFKNYQLLPHVVEVIHPNPHRRFDVTPTDVMKT